MRLSHYFDDLNKAYRAELDDLQTDSEGNNVLSKRLKEKRAEFSALVPMIEFAPEMVAPAFHGGISVLNPHALELLSFTEPDEFPSWEELLHAVQLEAWAEKLAALALPALGGERFMITVICLEFLHAKSNGKQVARQDSTADNRDEVDEDQREDSDEDEKDLEEAGADWLAEQGFDRRD